VLELYFFMRLCSQRNLKYDHHNIELLNCEKMLSLANDFMEWGKQYMSFWMHQSVLQIHRHTLKRYISDTSQNRLRMKMYAVASLYYAFLRTILWLYYIISNAMFHSGCKVILQVLTFIQTTNSVSSKLLFSSPRHCLWKWHKSDMSNLKRKVEWQATKA